MKRDERACPQCHCTIPKAAHLCKYCGKRFVEPAVGDEVASPPADRSLSNRGAVGCIVLAIAMAFLLKNLSSCDRPTPISAEVKSDENPYADVGKQNAWIAASQISIKARLKDPGSAEFRNVHFYSGGKTAVACGEVNAKNSFGGYSGYERFVAAGPTELAFLESDLSSRAEMNKIWKDLCVKAPADKA